MARRESIAVARSTTPRRRVLVFSPDKDLATSLSMLLEGQYSIVCETRVENLGQRIRQNSLSLLLIDLSTFPGDIRLVLEILNLSRDSLPVVVLHVFQRKVPELEEEIRGISDLVLYKPLEVDTIGEAIKTLLETE
ncbi:MAG: hypothetical protein FJ215_08580 [Ignavibacteria bacterium]|nr:hypothetical protein [Ignavibacteria bacterium]